MDGEMTLDAAWDCLNGLSLEMTPKDIAALHDGATGLAPGTIVAIPYLPGEDDHARIRSAARLRQLGASPMPHIAARRLPSRAALEGLLEGWAVQARIDRLLIIAGDCATAEGPFQDALSVIQTGLLARYGIGSVVISGYPEGHPKIASPNLAQAMRDKLAALAEQKLAAEIATQFSFSAAPVLDWLADLRASGIHVPVRLGIPGPASTRILLRYAAMCGVRASASVLARYGLSLTQLMGSAGPDKLVRDLAEDLSPARHGCVYAHYYPFGGIAGMLAWLAKQRAAI